MYVCMCAKDKTASFSFRFFTVFFFSAGSASLNARMNGMIAVRTLVYFILTSLLNAVLGVVLVLVIHPGNPGIRESIAPSHHARAVNILDSLLDLGR